MIWLWCEAPSYKAWIQFKSRSWRVPMQTRYLTPIIRHRRLVAWDFASRRSSSCAKVSTTWGSTTNLWAIFTYKATDKMRRDKSCLTGVNLPMLATIASKLKSKEKRPTWSSARSTGLSHRTWTASIWMRRSGVWKQSSTPQAARRSSHRTPIKPSTTALLTWRASWTAVTCCLRRSHHRLPVSCNHRCKTTKLNVTGLGSSQRSLFDLWLS